MWNPEPTLNSPPLAMLNPPLVKPPLAMVIPLRVIQFRVVSKTFVTYTAEQAVRRR